MTDTPQILQTKVMVSIDDGPGVAIFEFLNDEIIVTHCMKPNANDESPTYTYHLTPERLLEIIDFNDEQPDCCSPEYDFNCIEKSPRKHCEMGKHCALQNHYCTHDINMQEHDATCCTCGKIVYGV
jgi:hypothetical protein